MGTGRPPVAARSGDASRRRRPDYRPDRQAGTRPAVSSDHSLFDHLSRKNARASRRGAAEENAMPTEPMAHAPTTQGAHEVYSKASNAAALALASGLLTAPAASGRPAPRRPRPCRADGPGRRRGRRRHAGLRRRGHQRRPQGPGDADPHQHRLGHGRQGADHGLPGARLAGRGPGPDHQAVRLPVRQDRPHLPRRHARRRRHPDRVGHGAGARRHDGPLVQLLGPRRPDGGDQAALPERQGLHRQGGGRSGHRRRARPHGHVGRHRGRPPPGRRLGGHDLAQHRHLAHRGL